MLKKIIIIGLIALMHVVTYAQEKQNLIKNLTPIVQVFGTASYNFENNNYGYSFGRAHLGFQYQFNEKWSSKIIIDRGRATSIGEITVTDANGNMLTVQNTSKEGAYYTMFLKFASLQWKVNDKFTLEGGAILQNHYITQERFLGLRYVAQTFQDLFWHIPSSDLGFIADYKFNNVFSVDVAITNGEGPRKVQDAFGKVKFAGGIDVIPTEKIQTRFFYHNRQSKTNSEETEQLFSVFAGFKPTAKFRIGCELNYMKNLDNINNLNSYGFSLYSAYSLTNKTEMFARYDRLLYKASDNLSTNNKNGNSIIGGISHSPVKGVNLSLNYQGWLPDETSNQHENSILLSMEYKF
ncbi:MAG: hypothetical protein PF517_09060 [Salinivirgaceae bacterium]|jgi:hypothetical protein|nr:hypothetical protein [Salinivirgaceae bacterium]